MRRTIIGAVIATLALGSAAAIASPGPNGRNDYGLCTAYFAGSDTGRANKRKAPPFQALEAAAGVDSDDTPEERAEKVANYCANVTPGGTGTSPGGSAGDAGDAGAAGGRASGKGARGR